MREFHQGLYFIQIALKTHESLTNLQPQTRKKNKRKEENVRYPKTPSFLIEICDQSSIWRRKRTSFPFRRDKWLDWKTEQRDRAEGTNVLTGPSSFCFNSNRFPTHTHTHNRLYFDLDLLFYLMWMRCTLTIFFLPLCPPHCLGQSPVLVRRRRFICERAAPFQSSSPVRLKILWRH